MLLLGIAVWAAICLMAVALCLAAKSGDRVIIERATSTHEVDWVATVAVPTAAARPVVAPRSPQLR